MSYRAFKRLLGETSLERKCRFLFGAGILLLITVSFWVYAYLTERLAYDQAKTTCRLLVNPFLAKRHLSHLADRKGDPVPGVPVTWVSPVRAGTQAPFLLYYGEGPSYALVREEAVEDGATSYFHTSDPVLVEQLAFQLGRDLGIPIGE